MTEPTTTYLPPVQRSAYDHSPRGCAWCHRDRTREAVAAWEQWTDARSFDEHTAAATRLDAAMRALREVAT